MEEFDFEPAYVANGYSGVAWSITEWEIERVWDEHDHYERLTGNVIGHMIGDDRKFVFDPADLHAIKDDQYCRDCGQIGCGHNVHD